MSRITVQRQNWQRWPRVLIAEKRNDDGTVYERRYVPEGGAHDKWDGEREIVRCRDCYYYREHEFVLITDVEHACLFWADGVKVEPDGFCSWEEKKENHAG